jgi:hypothetical protein
MTLPSLPFFRSSSLETTSPIFRVVPRGDVQWERTIFKAPPLEVETPVPDASDFSEIQEGDFAPS